MKKGRGLRRGPLDGEMKKGRGLRRGPQEGEMKKGRGLRRGPSPEASRLCDGLADGAAGLREAGVQVGAERGHRADDHHRDQGDDEAVLDGRGARLVLRKARNKLGHCLISLLLPGQGSSWSGLLAPENRGHFRSTALIPSKRGSIAKHISMVDRCSSL